jgi:hypothetical protein
MLATRPGTAALTDVPTRVIAMYYAERFGGRASNPADRQLIDGDVRKLELALA